MAKQILRIAYISVPAYENDAVRLHKTNAELLDTCIRNNRRLEISGVLAACDDFYVQILEGEPERVHMLMERIESDRRHKDIRILFTKRVQSRRFTDWSMGHVDGDALAAELLRLNVEPRWTHLSDLGSEALEMVMADVLVGRVSIWRPRLCGGSNASA